MDWARGNAHGALIIAAIAFPALVFIAFVYLATGNQAVRNWGLMARNIVLDTIAAAMSGLLYVMFGILIAANLGIWPAGTALDMPTIMPAVFIGFLQVFTSLRHMGYWNL